MSATPAFLTTPSRALSRRERPWRRMTPEHPELVDPIVSRVEGPQIRVGQVRPRIFPGVAEDPRTEEPRDEDDRATRCLFPLHEPRCGRAFQVDEVRPHRFRFPDVLELAGVFLGGPVTFGCCRGGRGLAHRQRPSVLVGRIARGRHAVVPRSDFEGVVPARVRGRALFDLGFRFFVARTGQRQLDPGGEVVFLRLRRRL